MEEDFKLELIFSCCLNEILILCHLDVEDDGDSRGRAGSRGQRSKVVEAE
jgi:hypothetical protein